MPLLRLISTSFDNQLENEFGVILEHSFETRYYDRIEIWGEGKYRISSYLPRLRNFFQAVAITGNEFL
jgi:hypothetical protein